MLERRLVDIYKRGPLHTFQALLAAESFGDLLSRYKYLYLTSQQDRSLVTDVEKLRNRVVGQRNNILNVRDQLDRRREEREAEFSKYSELAAGARAAAAAAAALGAQHRAAAHRAPEGRVPAQRPARLAGARPPGRGGAGRSAAPRRRPGSITTADLGKLDWPVEGTIVYRFGRDTLPSGGIIRWNGVGIAAAVGTPVKAVEAGKVRLVGQFGTYGLTVVLEHGNGYYSVYSHLQSAAVKLGADGQQGQDDRDGRRRELRLRPAPALRDPGRESDRAGSDDLAAEAVSPMAWLSPRRRSARRLRLAPRQRGLDQREQVVGLGDRGMGIGDDARAEDGWPPRAPSGRAASRSRIRTTDRRAPSAPVSGSTIANSSPP